MTTTTAAEEREADTLLEAIERAADARHRAALAREISKRHRVEDRELVTSTSTEADEAMAAATTLVFDLVDARVADLDARVLREAPALTEIRQRFADAERGEHLAAVDAAVALDDYRSPFPRSIEIATTFGELVDAFTEWAVAEREHPDVFGERGEYTPAGLAETNAEALLLWLTGEARDRYGLDTPTTPAAS